MKLSRKFLEEYVDIDPSLTITDIANDMTNVGNEYDSAMPLINATKLVIGEVISCQNHPDSDHLHLCKVNIGSEILDIICGAPNVREGLKVITALDGATLPGGTIKKSTIRGYTSNGMLCSLAELGLDHKFLKEEDIEGICELDNNAPIGENPIKYLGLDDEVIDFELTSNRGDLLSVLGMAYEVGAIYNKKVKEVDLSYNKIDKQLDFNLEIKTENCPLFLVKKVENVVIEESPSFIKNRLIASGIRPINNVVDISNYVMLELGQPLHFYDADKLGNKITIRMATEGEHLTTLDGQDRILSNSDIVITDGTKPVGLAGVMGGFDTEVTKDTKNIIIESALFNSTSIRKTANKVLRSEASNRYEKGIDPNRTYMAMDRACHLLEKYAKGNILSEIVSYKNIDVYDKEIEISLEKINKDYKILVDQGKMKTFAYSKLVDELDGLSLKLSRLQDDLDYQLRSITSMKDDETRAREQLNTIEDLLKKSKYRLKDYKIPVIPSSYYIELTEAQDAIREIVKELDKKPIVIKILNIRVDTARDLVFKIYNKTNDMIKIVDMAEKMIVYGNRYRSSYEEIDIALTKAEELFRRGKYKESLDLSTKSISFIDKNIIDSD